MTVLPGLVGGGIAGTSFLQEYRKLIKNVANKRCCSCFGILLV